MTTDQAALALDMTAAVPARAPAIGNTPLEIKSARALERLRRQANAEQMLVDFKQFARAHRDLRAKGLMIDCPWEYENYSRKGEHKGAAAKYDCIPIAYLEQMPVAELGAPDHAIFVWATTPLLDQQIGCMKAWGYRYVGCEAWCKGTSSSTGEPGDETWKANFGTGYVRRGCAEYLLIGAIGKPEWLPGCRKLRNAFFDPIREHSSKPDAQYERVEQSVSGPYAEIFSRRDREGWVHFGNELGKFGEA